MTSTTPRIITIALATLALAAPAANAMPLYSHGEGKDAKAFRGDMRTSSLAGTPAAPKQDLRNADQQAPARNPVRPLQDLRNPDQRAPGLEAIPDQQPRTMAPVIRTQPQPAVADDDGPSPFVYIIPGVALIALLGAGFAYTRTSRPVRRSPA